MAFLRGRGEIGRDTGEPVHILHTCVRKLKEDIHKATCKFTSGCLSYLGDGW